ncbi:MAG TPA: hypothetical protein DCY25_02445 [Bacteroidales bacterium]|nr:hypothetical protein [Bacteroidales bacterium]
MKRAYSFISILLIIALSSCSDNSRDIERVNSFPAISPDYVNVTIPPNIAPLNFMIKDAEKINVIIEGKGGTFTARLSGNKAVISPGKWRNLLQKSAGDSLSITVSALEGGTWREYRPFHWHVAADEIDPFLSYRLIEPGYEVWSRISISQRDLTTFRERKLADNNLIDDGCVNCHIYSQQDPSFSFFHLRHAGGGTMIQQDGKFRKINTSTDSTISAGVYGSWHPSGRYLAFSTNMIIPEFHSVRNKRLEVYDTISDLIVLDLERNEVITSRVIAEKGSFETFPVFSADGTKLYFCSAHALNMPEDYNKARYSLCSVGFDPATGSFGSIVDTLISSDRTGSTVSHPKPSPDGRRLMFTSFDYGNFPVWHEEAELHLLDLTTGTIDTLPSVNSRRSDSYHSWSSEGRWFVFASKRVDNMYGRPYFAYIGSDGRASKPFVLPQKDPEFYDYFLKSYNIPELSNGPAPFNARDVERAFRRLEAEKVSFVRK